MCKYGDSYIVSLHYSHELDPFSLLSGDYKSSFRIGLVYCLYLYCSEELKGFVDCRLVLNALYKTC